MLSNRIIFNPQAISLILFRMATDDTTILLVPNESVRQDMVNLWKVPEDRVEVAK